MIAGVHHAPDVARDTDVHLVALADQHAETQTAADQDLRAEKLLHELLGSFPEPWRAPELTDVSRQRAEQL